MKSYFILLTSLFLVSCGNTYYIVRHAEKEQGQQGSAMNTVGDPPLSEAGKSRAENLKEKLKDQDIQFIFSTNTIRTIATAAPLQKHLGVSVNYYDHKDTLDQFISRLRNIRSGNVLIIGHSNTVDDIVNKLTGNSTIPGDLKDDEYDNLFVIKRRGGKFKFERKKY